MIPALLQWEITDRCPYRCPPCYHKESNLSGERVNELGDDQMWKIAEIIVSNKLFFVTFTGGEPLMRKELLVEIAAYLASKGLILSVNTTLSLMDEKTLEALAVHRILVSCPSTVPEVYNIATGNGIYSQFERRLLMLIAAQKCFTVNMVVSKINYKTVRQTALHMAEIGIKRFAATPASINAMHPNFSILLNSSEVRQVIMDLIWAHTELGLEVDIMESIPKCIMPQQAFDLQLPFVYRSCRAGKRNGTVSSCGDVRPCSHNPRVFGNILKENIDTIWNRMSNWRHQTGNLHQDCLGCDLFNNCGGGCRVDAEVRCGSITARHPYMDGTERSVTVSPQLVEISSEKVIRPVHSFQARPENGGWLVAPGSPRNIIHVNQMLYDFLVATRALKPMSLAQLAERFGTSYEDKNFQKIITDLVRKKFFILF